MSARYRAGDMVTPVNRREWYEWLAGWVTDATPRDGYLVRYPSGHIQTYGYGELRPAAPRECGRYVGGIEMPLDPSDSGYPVRDEIRHVWKRGS